MTFSDDRRLLESWQHIQPKERQPRLREEQAQEGRKNIRWLRDVALMGKRTNKVGKRLKEAESAGS